MLNNDKICVLSVAAIAFSASASYGDTVILDALQDNTLYEQFEGALSNGAGDFFFSGVTAQAAKRRGLIAFDIAKSVPEGAVINSVRLDLFMSMTIVGPQSSSLHLTLAAWGEGASDAPGGEGAGAPSQPGDATWLHTYFDTDTWASIGGDYEAASSASTMVGGIGFYNWESEQMANDVQMWLDNPKANYGWMMITNEAGLPTTKRFNSRTSAVVEQRPVLTIDFSLGGEPCIWDLDNSGTVGTGDLLELFAQWGTAGSADFDGSGAVGTGDLLILFANWGPC